MVKAGTKCKESQAHLHFHASPDQTEEARYGTESRECGKFDETVWPLFEHLIRAGFARTPLLQPADWRYHLAAEPNRPFSAPPFYLVSGGAGGPLEGTPKDGGFYHYLVF